MGHCVRTEGLNIELDSMFDSNSNQSPYLENKHRKMLQWAFSFGHGFSFLLLSKTKMTKNKLKCNLLFFFQ